MLELVDGFWLPGDIRQELITPDTPLMRLSFVNGQPCTPETPGR